MKRPQTILITGASSGLGTALALEYAPRCTELHLLGRDLKRLERVARACRRHHVRVHYACVDVTDDKAMERYIRHADRNTPFDLVITNAGVSGGTSEGLESDQQIRDIFEVNLAGVINTIQPLIPSMTARKRGQIAIISSLAGLHGLPSSPAYSASKGAVRIYGEAMRGLLAPEKVEVTVVCPGFIDTPMTRVNNYKMPLIMSAERAAKIIRGRLKGNPARIAFPWRLYACLRILQWLPTSWTQALLMRLPRKAPSHSATVTPINAKVV